MRNVMANRRPKRRFDNPRPQACPTDSCQVCRTLSRIDPSVKAFVNQRAGEVSLDTGESVPEQVVETGAVITVRSGMIVCQHLLDDGRRQVLGFVHPGEPLPHEHMARGVTAFAAIPSQLCIISQQTAADLKRKHPTAAIQLAELVLGGHDRRAEHLLLLGRLNVSEKIAYFLHDMAMRVCDRGAGTAILDLPMAREDIADFLGINAETLSRQITRMKKSGVIHLPKPDRVEIPDLQALRSQLPFQPAETAGHPSYSLA